MRFAHDDHDFGRIVSDVGEGVGINPGQIEKDYWITHVLWALHAAGLEVWFKGGTCLSKGYRLIERFSEDLDVKIGTGKAEGLPPSPNWKGERDTHIAKRAAWFDALAAGLVIDGCRLAVNRDRVDERARSAVFEVHYPGAFIGGLATVISPWVRLEIGSARMTPAFHRPISSWVHDELDSRAVWGRFDDNRPPPVHCVHPAVTLLEKLDAITRRWPRSDLPGRAFVRHYATHSSGGAAEAGAPACWRRLRSRCRSDGSTRTARRGPTWPSMEMAGSATSRRHSAVIAAVVAGAAVGVLIGLSESPAAATATPRRKIDVRGDRAILGVLRSAPCRTTPSSSRTASPP